MSAQPIIIASLGTTVTLPGNIITMLSQNEQITITFQNGETIKIGRETITPPPPPITLPIIFAEPYRETIVSFSETSSATSSENSTIEEVD